MEFRKPGQDDPNTLLGDRFLCRGGGALLVGPTGIGKSSLQMQMAISFALGRECFGIQPREKLRSLIVQAENDDGDMAEMRDGVIEGMDLSDEDLEWLGGWWEPVQAFHETGLRGESLVRDLLMPLCDHHAPDLLWIDPALSYLDGEPNSAKEVGEFLRSQLNPLAITQSCGVILVAHTAKPPRVQQSNWKAGDNAYSTLGSVEWANWARGVITLNNVGSHSVFRLSAPKRGKRLGWEREDGEKTTSRMIAHSEKGICWRDVSEEEWQRMLEENRGKAGAKSQYDPAEILACLSEPLEPRDWQNTAMANTGISRASFQRFRKDFLDAGKVVKEGKKYRVVSQSKSHETET
ncbi:MAG: AAA family ATPase [Verrucomicrobiales bacterium]|nr:AAA family ATPase [Verrucomicrobiales bacterium]